jgi:hypothetical protein
MAEPVKTPIAEGMIDRVVRGVKYVVSGADPSGWFTPSQPLPPFAQEQAVGRQFDYQTGYNLQQQPKVYEGVTFAQLRSLADGLDILRLVIETRKDMLCKMQFTVKPTDPSKPIDSRCELVQNFLRFPDKEHSWEEWLRMILEDLFVLDAPAIYPRYTYGNSLYAFEPMDGATIKRVIDGQGRTPVPPEMAYQQILKGVPAVAYSSDELIYKPRNLRTNKVYGYSPVEQILLTVNTALRRQVSQLQYYSDGDAVDRIMSVPAEWNPDQVAQFRDWWTSMLAGNTGARRQTMFVPNGVTSVNTKEALLKDSYDEWLARVICYAFSISPSAFVSQMNRATANTAKESAEEEGIQPIMQWIKSLVDYMIMKYFGYTDICLQWQDELAPDPLIQAQINQIYIGSGIKTPNEVREELGLDAIDDPIEESKPFMTTSNQVVGAQILPNQSYNTNEVSNNPNESAQKVEKASKKLLRGITTLNRERATVNTNIIRLKKVTKTGLQKKAKQYVLAIESARMKMGKAVDESKETVDKILATLNINWNDFADDVEPYLRAMALDGVKQAAVQIQLQNINGADVNLANERAEAYAQERAAEMVGKKLVDGRLVENPNAQWALANSAEASDATRDYLRADITQAIEQGWSNQQLADKLVENYAFSEARAETIARTEIGNADIEGNMQAYQEARDNGIEIKKRWIAGADECDECAANAEQGAIDFDDVFISGDDAPLAHPNCRCDLLPVLVGDDGDNEKLAKYSEDQERDEQGRFGSGGGGSSSNTESQRQIGWNHMDSARVQGIAKEVAEAHYYDPNKITISSENQKTYILEKKVNVSGRAFKDGRIEIYAATMYNNRGTKTDEEMDNKIRGTLAHEIGHQISNEVIARSEIERQAIERDPRAVKDLAGQYPASFNQEYPVYTAINNMMTSGSPYMGYQLEQYDGVTNYSRAMWNGYYTNFNSKTTAVKETFSEINKLAYLQSGGGKKQTTLANLKAVGVKPPWQKFYRAYMSAWKEMQTNGK